MPANWKNRTMWTGDNLDNLQLLCGACNSMKGTDSQEQLIAKLTADGIRQ